MAQDTPNLALPYIAPQQAQKHVTYNEAIRRLDALVQLSVRDRTRIAPPSVPAEGDRHIVAAPATGAWAGEEGAVAAFQDGAWAFYPPAPGWRAYDEASGALLAFDGADWTEAGFDGEAPLLGVNASADATNRLAVASPAVLFSHEGADTRVKINKAAAGDTASLLFQNGFSGRAEIGATGDDQFRIKVSADGAVWREAVTVDAATGNVGVRDASPQYPLEVGGIIASTHGYPAFFLTETDQPTDQRVWRMSCAGGNFSFQTQNDANTIARNAIVITRSGVDVTGVQLHTQAGVAILADAAGNVGVGATAPTTRLHVNGALRVGQYAKAALPAAASAGAGAVAYVTDAAGGPELAYSDGAVWRRASDKAPV